jgi:hypothetical protein
MKVFTVVVRNVTDKLKKLRKHKRGHCESEEFWAGPLFWVLWRPNLCSGAGWLHGWTYPPSFAQNTTGMINLNVNEIRGKS